MIRADLSGTRLGKYRLLNLLGRGGMGEVYLAEHEMLQSKVAVKVLPADLARDQGMVQRFLREARAAASLRHPHIIGIHDVGQEAGVNYFSMDYIEGRSLTELIASAGGLPESEIIRISRQVLSALAEAHGAGIIHRDIKPDNVIIDLRGDAMVMDFGIAKAAAGTRVTAVGSFMGTVHYASPEQVRGLTVDSRGDLYSWGVVMYEMATGRAPFAGQETAAVFYQHVHEIPASPQLARPELSPGLTAIILRLLEKDPADRFASAQSALAALERLEQAAPAGRTVAGTTACPGGPVSEQGLRDRAQALLADGSFDDAARVITELVGLTADKAAALTWLEQVQAQAGQAAVLRAALQRGRALEAAGDLPAAQELCDGLATDYAGHPLLEQMAQRLQCRRLAGEATALLDAGDLDGGRQAYQRACELKPSEPDLRGALDALAKRVSRAQRAEALRDQAALALDSGDGRQALALLAEAAELAPGLIDLDELTARARQAAEAQPPPPPPPPTSGTRVAAAPAAPPGHTVLAGAGQTIIAPVASGPERPAPEPPNAPPAPAPAAGVSGKVAALAVGGFLLLAVAASAAWWAWRTPGQPQPPAVVATGQAQTPGPAAAQSARALAEADALLAQDKLDQAEAAYGQALQLDPASSAARQGLENVAKRRQTAQRLEEQRRRQAAEQADRLAVQGRELLRQGQIDQAERAFRQALEAQPGHAVASEGLRQSAKLRQQASATPPASADSNKADKIVDLARTMIEAGQFEQAQGVLNRAAQLDPDSQRAGLWREYAQDRLAEMARGAAPATLQQQMERSTATTAQAAKIFRQGRVGEAEALFRQAQREYPDSRGALRGLEIVRQRSQGGAPAR